MTDPITCPECGGRGETAIGTLRLKCRFCHGRGTVGGDYEPAEGGHQRTDGYRMPEEGEDYDPEVHGPLPAVGEHPAVTGSGLCTTCLGARVVVTEMLTEMRCPACSTS